MGEARGVTLKTGTVVQGVITGGGYGGVPVHGPILERQISLLPFICFDPPSF